MLFLSAKTSCGGNKFQINFFNFTYFLLCFIFFINNVPCTDTGLETRKYYYMDCISPKKKKNGKHCYLIVNGFFFEFWSTINSRHYKLYDLKTVERF